MGVERRHSHVKFSKTIRLGRNADLDDAVAGEVEVGSLRDSDTNVQRWNGTFWENIGAPLLTKEIDDTDSPYQALPNEDIILGDATNGNIIVIPPLAAVLKKKQTVMMVNGQSASKTVDIVPANGELINKAANKLISVDLVAWTYISDGTQLLIIA